ncbi:RlpA-like double-psi beta-barrel domain-containing protein [Ohtaekwangia koreensis]|uniref:Uncharacterized protein n=1 Tax=Ohtaekwangia koreensis TaxID=688867 RepID=A0A1T5LAA5_9BACT|nr:hypothetical protein [Ohtaekwangia koreensis]SKC72844.1 hypothetical protein SAMN05660236_2821 [Ohtaekwangia koreensis]
MKKTFKTILVVIILMMTPMIGSYTKEAGIKHTIRITKEYTAVLETLTIYNPVKRQCDNTPLVTASNARIDVTKLKKQEIRWLALSRNLLKRWNGNFHYGDTVKLSSGDPSIDGVWIIQDNLNKRYKNCGDLLFDSNVRKLGKWKNVKISKVISTSVLHPIGLPIE